MFGIGLTELCVIAAAALIVVGPRQLPEMMRQLGRFFVQMRRMSSDVRHSMEQVVREAEEEVRLEDLEKSKTIIAETTSPAPDARKAGSPGKPAYCESKAPGPLYPHPDSLPTEDPCSYGTRAGPTPFEKSPMDDPPSEPDAF